MDKEKSNTETDIIDGSNDSGTSGEKNTLDEILKIDYDGLWKDVIDDFFEDFCMFFAPDVYELIDFSKGYTFIEQELNSLFSDSELGKKRTDKLAKVNLKSGEEKWILVHVEVQGYKDKHFADRMFKYFYRIYDKYNKKIFAIALFSDSNENYEPNEFKYEFFDTRLIYSFRTYKILTQSEVQLSKSKNPFAMAILAGLFAIKSKKNVDIKYEFKMKLIRLLKEKRWCREKIESLFLFIDALLKLPDIKEIELENNLKIILGKEDDGMPKLTWDKSNLAQVYTSKGMEKGMQEGQTKKMRSSAKKLLKNKFKLDILPNELVTLIDEATIEDLDEVEDLIFEIESIDWVINFLKTKTKRACEEG